jgi:hypothetical protein
MLTGYKKKRLFDFHYRMPIINRRAITPKAPFELRTQV